MKKQNDSKTNLDLIRRKAEKKYNVKQLLANAQNSEANVLKIVHELEVHQIELELINEELMLAKANEAKLATSKYIELYDFAPIGYCTLSKEGSIIELNLSAANLLGKERSLLINSRLGFFISEKSRPAFNQFLDKVLGSKVKETCELTLFMNNKLSVQVEIIGIATHDNQQCLITIIDITEHKKAEEDLQELIKFNDQIINGVHEGVVVYDLDMKYIIWNRYMENLTGLAASEVLGKHPLDVFPFLNHSGFIRIIDMSLQGKNNEEIDFPFNIPSNGKAGWISNITGPLLNTKGEIIGAISTVKDITERKRIEEERKQTQEKLRAFATMLQKSREDERKGIAREIHDEFGQVLTALKMNLTILGNDLFKTERPYNESEIVGEINNMKTILDHTIQSVRIFTNKLRPDILDSFGLVEALETYVSEFSQLYKLECIFNKPDEKLAIDMDISIAVYRIVQEALTNIVRHARASKVTIAIARIQNNLFLSIQDNGVGMEEVQRNDMKRFGIIGMNERAYIFGGKLEISSEPGKGTRINLTIPL